MSQLPVANRRAFTDDQRARLPRALCVRERLVVQTSYLVGLRGRVLDLPGYYLDMVAERVMAGGPRA